MSICHGLRLCVLVLCLSILLSEREEDKQWSESGTDSQQTGMAGRTEEVFLSSCLDGEAGVVGRILRRAKRSWTGRTFNINVRDSNGRTGLYLACRSVIA